MKLSFFDYNLPPELIAQHPVACRTDSRLLVYDRKSDNIVDSHFKNLLSFIDNSYFLVINDSKVFKARLFAKRATGGKVEVFLVRRVGGNQWVALLRPSKRIRAGEKLYFNSELYINVLDDPGTIERIAEFNSQENEEDIIAQYGKVPLPPYIRRSPIEEDIIRYQTVYAAKNGSVAAPTAGLHFDQQMLEKLMKRRIAVERVTLHVGPGTFKPVTADDIEDHYVDPEYAEISSDIVKAINQHKANGKKLIAIGTTSVRILEAAVNNRGNLPKEFDQAVDLYIYPPYKFKIVDALLTNFHLPKSSLLMLVAAFCGREKILELYQHAIKKKYRFYSYGDCMLII
jgi:S-adenosylmethionine:tRNA ribosyltransferase-isomerase